ncbi:MAG: SLBB domain-containing protein [Pyrinomonadaceae bacterium]|nr:SLBB domain-containing protein [Pyrinomonadaceae bacterium]
MKAINFLAVFCFVLASGLSVIGQTTETPKQVEKISTEAHKTEIAETMDNQTPAKNPTSEKYRIGFQDTLEVQVFRHPELSLVVNVSPDGTILMPKINQPIIAVCKTERELGAFVGALYKSYLRNPFVSVRAIEQRSQPFAVIGAVEKPGSFYLNRKIRLLELLAFAGGPKTEKSGSKIQVARVGNPAGCTDNSESDNDKVVFLGYKINDVMNGKENPWMEPGDIVSVLEAEEAYVVGDVKEPARISLKETVTLTQAIAAAGGIKSEAKTSRVRIQRQEANSPLRTEMVFDLKDISAKKIPDPVLQANDIVEVPKDGLKAVRNGIIKALSGGVGGIFTRF